MSSVVSQLLLFPKDKIAITSTSYCLTYGEVIDKVNLLSDCLNDLNVASIVIHADNSVDWLLLDLACQQLGVVFTPIPLFFSQDQVEKVLESVKPDLVFTDQPIDKTLYDTIVVSGLSLIAKKHKPETPLNVPKSTCKITYTSGSTGQPKGVCLSLNNQIQVAKSLVERVNIRNPRHLCLLPLPTLLENIAGVYSPLLADGTVIIPTSEESGFKGSLLKDALKLISCIEKNAPNTLILVPELLLVLVGACKQGWKPPQSLKFIAVGGSKCSSSLNQYGSKV